MKTKATLGILALAGLTLVGCANTYYEVIRIPDTPDALAAYRQCATAPHFSEVGACLAGIPDVTSTGWVSDTSKIAGSSLCRQIIGGSYTTTNFWTFPFPSGYYHYSVQACPTPPPVQ